MRSFRAAGTAITSRTVSISAQETYEQAAIQFDDQVDLLLPQKPSQPPNVQRTADPGRDSAVAQPVPGNSAVHPEEGQGLFLPQTDKMDLKLFLQCKMICDQYGYSLGSAASGYVTGEKSDSYQTVTSRK